MSKQATKLPTLEKSMDEITGLIENMENGELTLEKSLTQFERGITLIKHCQKILNDAEQKVQVLIQQNQQDSLKNYDNLASDEDDDNATNS